MEIKERTMLVHLKLSSCGFTKVDHEATGDILEQHSAGNNAGKFTKHLLPQEAIKPVNTIVNLIRTVNKQQTLPFDDSHWRLLTTDNYIGYLKVINELIVKLREQVEVLIDQFGHHKERAKSMLGGMYKETDYPTPDEIRGKYRIETDFRNVPSAGNFLVNLSDEHLADIQNRIEESTKAKLADAQKDLWRQLLEVTKHFADTMAKDEREIKDKDGKVTGYRAPLFKDTTLTNITRVTELVPKLNVTNDPELDQLAADINTALNGYSPVQLRQSSTTRAGAAAKGKAAVDRITKAMEGAY